MGEVIFRASDLCKSYNNNMALNHVNMKIKHGDIYGFIGENGAGKTTTIRILTGLANPTQGEIELFGKTGQKDLAKQRKRIGCIIEAPAVYPDMSAWQNLEVHRIQRGIPGRKCIDEVLELVNLTSTGKKPAKDFSLGMKQRLGLAIALLGEPEFLILDEPTNGLDPIGIVEIRELLKRLNREKDITILISSHILSELHQLATCFGIIHKGNLLEQISGSELDEKCKKHIRIEVTDTNKAVSIIENQLNTQKFEVYPDNVIKLCDYLETVEVVSHALFSGGVGIKGISLQCDSLETYFTRLIVGGKAHA